MCATDAGLLGKLKQTSGARIITVDAVAESGHTLPIGFQFIQYSRSDVFQ